MKLGFLSHLLCLTISTQLSGQTRQVEPVRLDSGTRGLLVAIHFLDGRTGFAVGANGEKDDAILQRTNDGGRTWSSYETGLKARLYDVHFPTRQIGMRSACGAAC